MGAVAYTILPIVTIFVFGIYLFFRVYNDLKNSTLKKSRKITISIAVGASITLPIAGLWTTIAAYSIAVVYFCVFLLLTDFVTFIVRLLYKRKNKAWQIISRFMLIPLLCTVIVFTYGLINVRNVVVTEYSITTNKNIRAGGYKIVLLSDVHYGKLNNKKHLERLAQSISAQEPDIVIACGDIVDEATTTVQMEEIFSILGSIRSAYGSYFIFGNHDEQPYNKKPSFNRVQLVSVIEQNAITVLDDDAVVIDNDILLVGRRDRKDDRKSVEELLIGADNSKYVIFAEHKPNYFNNKAGAGVDLSLSGHTHGGQLFPVGTLMNLFGVGDMVYGKKQVGNMTAITTSGLAGSYPLRTQGKSEYVVITLSN